MPSQNVFIKIVTMQPRSSLEGSYLFCAFVYTHMLWEGENKIPCSDLSVTPIQSLAWRNFKTNILWSDRLLTSPYSQN